MGSTIHTQEAWDLIAYFLMLYTATKIEEMNKFDSFHSEETHSARLFAWFLTMFGEYFDYETMAIMFVQGYIPMTFPKIYWGIDPTQNPKMLWVYDPLKSNNNTTVKPFVQSHLCLVPPLSSPTFVQSHLCPVPPLSSPHMKLEKSLSSRQFDVNLDYFYLNNY